MSNNNVGEVYAKVIQEVVDTSLIDFEEAGIASATLEDLKNLWQRKLTNTGVAHFPWDPAPPPSAQADTPVNKKGSQNAQMKKEAGMGASQPGQQQGEPKIKAEPGLESQEISAPPVGNAPYGPDREVAQHRATQAIQAKFGQDVANKFHQQQHQNPQQGHQHGTARPGLMLPGGLAMPQQAQQQHQYQQPRANGLNGIPQQDGADDEMDFSSMSKEQADNVILKNIQDAEKQNAELYEALKSLSVKSKSKKARVRSTKAKRLDAYEEALSGDSDYPHPSATPISTFRSVAGPAQLDGPGSMEPEDDEDAINSDLDDSEDEEINNDDDDETQQIMLCMYDKVQRTKNKWKCVLKDGVLTINGKEYVFHKATGEYEW